MAERMVEVGDGVRAFGKLPAGTVHPFQTAETTRVANVATHHYETQVPQESSKIVRAVARPSASASNFTSSLTVLDDSSKSISFSDRMNLSQRPSLPVATGSAVRNSKSDLRPSIGTSRTSSTTSSPHVGDRHVHITQGNYMSHSANVSHVSATQRQSGTSAVSLVDLVPIDRLSVRHLLVLKQRAYDYYAATMQRCGLSSETRPFSTFILAGFYSQTNASWSNAAKKRQPAKRLPSSSASNSFIQSSPTVAPSATDQQSTSVTATWLKRSDSPSKESLTNSVARDESSNISGIERQWDKDASLAEPTRDVEFSGRTVPAASCAVFGVPLTVLQAHFDDVLPPCILHTMRHIDAELRAQCVCDADRRSQASGSQSHSSNSVIGSNEQLVDSNNSVAVAGSGGFALLRQNSHHDQSNVVGVFRKAGLRSRISEMRSLFDARPSLTNFTGSAFSEALLYDYCDVLKQFFRDLPECLLTGVVSHFLLSIASSSEWSALVSTSQYEQLRFEALHCAFMLLPDANKRALRKLFSFLQRVAAHEADTNMNLYNLAVCFCPSLFDFSISTTGSTTLFAGNSPTNTAAASAAAGALSFNSTATGVQWLITMIQHADRLFSIPRWMYEAWMNEDRVALERLRTAQSSTSSVVSTSTSTSSLKSSEKERKPRSAGDWRKQLSFLWRSKAPRDLEPAASLFVRPVTYKRGDAMRFDELGSRLLNGRVNFMRFVDYACQTLEKASESQQLLHSVKSSGKNAARQNTITGGNPTTSPSSSTSSLAYNSKSNRIWLKYNLAQCVSFDVDGIEVCIKRSKFERKKLKEAAESSAGHHSQSQLTRRGSIKKRESHESLSMRRSQPHTPVANTASFNAASFDTYEQQALIAYPLVANERKDRSALLINEHSVALWRVRFELDDVPIARLCELLSSAALLHDVFDLQLVETIEQFNDNTVLERVRRCGPVDRQVREYTVLRSRRAHFSVAAPDSVAIVITSVVDFETHLSKPLPPVVRRATAPATSSCKVIDSNNNSRDCGRLRQFAEEIRDAVICDLHILAEPADCGSRVTVLNREELRGYTHEWYVQSWPIVLARWMVRLRDYLKAA